MSAGMRQGGAKGKRAMGVDVFDMSVQGTISEYNCPSCKTTVRGGIDSNVTRFKCTFCERELIINKRRR